VTGKTSDNQARLTAELRQLRATAGLGGIEAGRRAGISQSKISKIENQLLRPSPDDVRALCQGYGSPIEQRNVLVRLADSLRADAIEPRRVTLSRSARNMQQRIRRREASAHLLRTSPAW